MKAIKFTGRDSYGQWFTGSLVQEACTMIVNNVGRFVVEPESVKQFIGVDGRYVFFVKSSRYVIFSMTNSAHKLIKIIKLAILLGHRVIVNGRRPNYAF